ncbi:acyloxyacyl hydrolase [Fulvivirga sp. 29W222]|uniref:Acyloxyacyl hydrolase n=1 Tax=Fulvivirga marina TaxID=2494733 RepID=A0A937FWB1_9BACT|nr:acyloxyacyl hydrolase [Fulvivirga marina]MBL6445521.1 acyloxyacyl hydrolase [Fulvivirga marina]
MLHFRGIILIFCLALPSLGLGQFRNNNNKVIGIDYFKGFILKHKRQIGHLITEHPIGFRITYDQKSYGTEAWQQRYNFPDIGFTFIYLDYRDERLGKSFGLIPHFSFYVNKNKQAKSQFKYKIGLGLGYNTNKYNKESNNKNNALSTDINFGILFQAEYQLELTERLFLNTHLAFTHFSNGAIKKPNSGINVVSGNLGLSYLINYKPTEHSYIGEEPVNTSGLGYTLTLSTGMHEYSKIGTGSRPFWVLSTLADKRLNHKSALGITLEWFASLSMKNDIKYDYRLEGTDLPDWHRIGMALSHELFINNTSLISQAGYYIYDEYDYYGKVYFRLGVRKYINDKIYSSLMVKSHGAKAEAAEFAIGWRVK